MQIDYLAHAAVGFFALVLFSLSVYAYSRRRHVGLVLVSSAFLLFTLKEVLWFLSQLYALNSSIELTRTLVDFVVLGLFFVAITLRPRKQLE
jgi:ABC-type maltose transport system permease subunit